MRARWAIALASVVVATSTWSGGAVAGAQRHGALDGFGVAAHPAAVADAPAADAPPRPQDPRAPFPYRSEQVRFRNGAIPLAGTLTVPTGDGPFEAVVLLSGSGPQDRDEQIVGHRPFLVMADSLTRAGYAVLRVDDRGVGGSGGELRAASFELVADDALAGVRFLAQRPEIDPDRIGLLGHSEGGYIAPLAAGRSDAVDFVILMAGPAVDAEQVLLEQTRLISEVQGATEGRVRREIAFVRKVAPLLRAADYPAAEALTRRKIARDSAELPAKQRPTPDQVDAAVAALVSPHMHAFFAYDPARHLRALEVPVLAFFGGTDLQVPAAQNAPPMRTLLADNPDADVRVFHGLNHLMQPSATGDPADYATIETTIAPEVLTGIADWLAERD